MSFIKLPDATLGDRTEAREVLTIALWGETLVTILKDGTIETGPNYTPDKAAMVLWEAVASRMPVRRAETLLAEVRVALWSEIDPAGNNCEDFGSMIDTAREVVAEIDAAFPPPGQDLPKVPVDPSEEPAK